MSPLAIAPSPRRRRLAWSGALFLAFDALLIGVVIVWITGGRHLGLAAAFVAVGVLVSGLLAAVVARPPKARIAEGRLHVEADFQRLSLPLAGARMRRIDLRDWPAAELPAAMRAPRWWQGGDAMGWQRDRDGRRWFAALPGRIAALEIEAEDGERLRLAPAHREAFVAALQAAGAREA
ncbi:MAG: hypothetical protein KGZ52_09170 [Xanthomonadaceae bacterium]|nr:hypothetical protein [Xanthomonadaceae bacterium]